MSKAGPIIILWTLKTLTKLSTVFENFVSLSPLLDVTIFFLCIAYPVSPFLDYSLMMCSSLSSREIIFSTFGGGPLCLSGYGDSPDSSASNLAALAFCLWIEATFMK